MGEATDRTIKQTRIGSEPIATYTGFVGNNLDIGRPNEMIKLKVKFEDGECKSPSYLKVLFNDKIMPFEWMDCPSDQPIGNTDNAKYSSGYLKCGYLIFQSDLGTYGKTAKIEVYDSPITQDFSQKVSLTYESKTNLLLTAGTTTLRLNGTRGFAINDLKFNGQSIGNSHMQQIIFVGSSNEEQVLLNQSPATIQTTGTGIAYRQITADYPTQISGVQIRFKALLYSNGRVVTERIVIFDKFYDKLKALKFKNYFQQPAFTRLSDLSVTGFFNQKNFLLTNHDIQYIENGGKDGINDGKVNSITSGFGTNGYTVAINVAAGKEYAPVQGAYFSNREIYSWSKLSSEDQELIVMNPCVCSPTKLPKDTLQNKLIADLEYLIKKNNDPKLYNWRLRLGYATLLMTQAELNNSVEKDLPAIQKMWDEAMSTFDSSTKMWELYTRELKVLGLEYQGRNQQMLPEAIAFFERHNMPEQKKQAEQMINSFCEFYVAIEAYAGKNGSVYLAYATKRENLNAEAAALNGFYLKKAYFGSLTDTEQAACNRIETKFLRSIRCRNLLPYIEKDNLLHQYKLHYALFSSYAFSEHFIGKYPYHLSAHAEAALLPSGKFYEMAFNWQSTRRGQPHTSLYAVYLLLLRKDDPGLQEALYVLENLKRNMDTTGKIKVPLDDWVTNEASGELNTLIALMVAIKIMHKLKS